MKTIISLILAAILAYQAGNAQVLKIIAVSQVIYGGAPMDKTIKKGEEIDGGTPAKRYFLYAVISDYKQVYITRIWIERKLYTCKALPVTRFPVIIPTADNGIFQNDTLIESSVHPVVRLEIELVKSNTAWLLSRQADQHDIVLEYIFRKRAYRYVVKKIKVTDPLYAPIAPPVKIRND